MVTCNGKAKINTFGDLEQLQNITVILILSLHRPKFQQNLSDDFL